MCLMKVTLAAGSTTTLSSTGTFYYAIKGKAYSHAAWSAQATPTTDYATGKAFLPVPANYGSSYVVGIDSGGTMRVIQSTVVPLDSAGAFITAPQFGATGPAGSGSTANDFCPVGYVVIKADVLYVATTTGWLFGTHDLSSVTGITYGFGDLVSWPGRPLIA